MRYSYDYDRKPCYYLRSRVKQILALRFATCSRMQAMSHTPGTIFSEKLSVRFLATKVPFSSDFRRTSGNSWLKNRAGPSIME